eukprot:scaffold2705_cov109-Isochrysis_galbana.AAC.10
MATSPPAPLKPNALGRQGFLSLTSFFLIFWSVAATSAGVRGGEGDRGDRGVRAHSGVQCPVQAPPFPFRFAPLRPNAHWAGGAF